MGKFKVGDMTMDLGNNLGFIFEKSVGYYSYIYLDTGYNGAGSATFNTEAYDTACKLYTDVFCEQDNL